MQLTKTSYSTVRFLGFTDNRAQRHDTCTSASHRKRKPAFLIIFNVLDHATHQIIIFNSFFDFVSKKVKVVAVVVVVAAVKL